MIIQLSPEADLKLKEMLGSRPGAVRLIYDTEGCGCAVNGVPGLQVVDGAADGDTVIQTNASIPLVIHGKQEVFSRKSLSWTCTPAPLVFVSQAAIRRMEQIS